MIWDVLREIQSILERSEGHAVNIDVNKDRTGLSWRVDDMPHYEWQLKVKRLDSEKKGR